METPSKKRRPRLDAEAIARLQAQNQRDYELSLLSENEARLKDDLEARRQEAFTKISIQAKTTSNSSRRASGLEAVVYNGSDCWISSIVVEAAAGDIAQRHTLKPNARNHKLAPLTTETWRAPIPPVYSHSTVFSFKVVSAYIDCY